MKNFKKNLKGYSLTELVLAIGIFAIISSMLVLLVVDATRTLENTRTRSKASLLTQDVYNSLILIKSQAWYELAQHTNDGNKYLDYSSGTYNILDGERNEEGLTYSFTVEEVQRDSNRNIVESGGTVDPHSRLISINISWVDRIGKVHTINPRMYVNDWNTNSVIYTTLEDFSTGVHNQTIAVDNDGGETRLQSRYYSDWCNPALSLNEYDIPGEATPRSVFSLLGSSYLGTRGELTGQPFTKLNIEGVDPPILTVEGYFSGYNVNDIFVLGDYAFLATTDNSKEVVILDISSLPYTEIGYFDAPDSYDGYSVFVDGDVGYLGQGRFVRSFNLSSYNGARSLIGSKDLSTWLFRSVANVSQIYAKDNYLYAVLNWDWYELVIVNISNPASMSITSQTSVNNQQVYDMEVSQDGNRVYFGTTASSSEKEVFIIDTSSKSGSRPKIASLEMSGTTVRGIAVIEEDNILITVGTGGEEYKVYHIIDEANPTYCGGMDINNGIYDIDSIRDSLTNAFSYIVTGDTNSEFKIIRGGPGGGGVDGYGYFEDGIHISSPYDTQSDMSEYRIVNIDADIPTATTLRIQLRSSNTPLMTGSTWLGPDGTSNTYYESSGSFPLPSTLSGRYIQYKAEFLSDTISTPLLEELIINYDK